MSIRDTIFSGSTNLLLPTLLLPIERFSIGNKHPTHNWRDYCRGLFVERSLLIDSRLAYEEKHSFSWGALF